MFGPDTPLVMDALQIAALATAVGASAVWLLLRQTKRATGQPEATEPKDMELSKRVEVLERIATDQSIGLAEEIEALRDNNGQQAKIESTAR
ncbi:hypothetical protein [Erythrobacter sp. F6033]|uniref:hypothetical protein n=1 Tax=Erythrobacter sp. F6033 TaxID=2926401 RepID=UPI001FF69FAA|nr:hypothetical protein [Erythrobacter sp. F6033]MCK0127727.1 hypothetical protein [Erythrobacter sp. F6033]